MLAHFRVAQKKYFSINIVDLYNQHRYAIVGEELSGFPALGAIEAMACGCVLIGQAEYYVGLGLAPWIHFVPFDGNIESIPLIIQEYDLGKMAMISEAGAGLVLCSFSPLEVHNRWLKTLDEI